MIFLALAVVLPIGAADAQLNLFGGRGGRSADCAAPESSRDGDVRRHASVIKANNLCVTYDDVTDTYATFRFTIVSGKRGGPVWYMPHDNEQTAFAAAIGAVARYGGKLVAIETGDRRALNRLDPNRIFAKTAAQARSCAIGRPLPRYTDAVMNHFRSARHVLSIHNNTRGGGISVNMRSAKVQGFRARGSLNDSDHLVFIAGTAPIGADRAIAQRRDQLLGAGLNVVYEQVTAANNDCSMSNYVTLNDRRPYYNVEAVHGSALQDAMVDRLMGILGYRAR